jgi:hypothetical protein
MTRLRLPLAFSPSRQLFLASILLLGAACAAIRPTGEASAAPDLACNELSGATESPLKGALAVNAITVDDLPGVRADTAPNSSRPAGVLVSIPAPLGWSKAWLERRILCYRQVTPARVDDVLLVESSRVRVRESIGRYRVSITSEDAEAARRIVAAATTLAGGNVPGKTALVQ